MYILPAATKHGLLVVEGDEAKLPEVKKPPGRNTSAFILSFTLSGLGSGDSKLHQRHVDHYPSNVKGMCSIPSTSRSGCMAICPFT